MFNSNGKDLSTLIRKSSLPPHFYKNKAIPLPIKGKFKLDLITKKGTHDSTCAKLCSIGLDPLTSLDQVKNIYHKNDHNMVEDLFTLTNKPKEQTQIHQYENGNIVRIKYKPILHPDGYRDSTSSVIAWEGENTFLGKKESSKYLSDHYFKTGTKG